MAVHRLTYLGFRGFWILREQLRTLDRHSIVASAALRRLHVDKSLLERMKRGRLRHAILFGVERGKSFKGGYGLATHISHRHDTGADFDAVREDRTGAALRQ